MYSNSNLIRAAIELIKKGGTYNEADCKTFVERSIRNIGLKCAYSGSNDMIRRMVIDVKPIDGGLRAGDIVFWVKSDGNEPARYKRGGDAFNESFAGWNATHVGISLGNGYLAESANSIGHWAVTELKKRKPNYYGRHPQIEYISAGDEILEAIKSLVNIKANESRKESNQGKVSEKATNENSNLAIIEEYKKTSIRAKIDNKGKYVNLRAMPIYTSKILARMEDGQEILIINYLRNDWARVIYQDKIGYCNSKMIAKIEDIDKGEYKGEERNKGKVAGTEKGKAGKKGEPGEKGESNNGLEKSAKEEIRKHIKAILEILERE